MREADRRKDAFLATLAHELRNPLAPISNGLQAWPSVEGDPARMEQLRAMMDRQVHQMIRLIDDLMDVSRITRGKIQLRKERVALATLIAGAVESVEPLMHARKHQLTVQLPSEPVWIDGDLVRLTQVFGNILNNAAKYTVQNGIITVTADRQGDWVVVKVRDNGPGIPDHMLSEIFEMFRQVDQTLERSHGGLGIGLTLVKRLVEMHGGTVEARSEGPQRGSELIVTLPAIVVNPRAVPDGLSGTSDSAASMPRHRVLVVDDLPELTESFATLLEVIGQQVFVAYNGPSAIESARVQRPNVAFLDIAMPGMNGYEVARRLRTLPELKGLTLVALTGFGQDEDRRKAAEAGFDHHLTKPSSQQALKDLLLSIPVRGEEEARQIEQPTAVAAPAVVSPLTGR